MEEVGFKKKKEKERSVKRGCVNFFPPIPKREGGSWRSLQHPRSVRRHPGANTPAHHNQLPIVATYCKLHNSRHKGGGAQGGDERTPPLPPVWIAAHKHMNQYLESNQ